MKRPDKILDIFKTLSDEAAREIADIRDARDKALKAQVATLQSIEKEWGWARRDRSLAGAAATYGRTALKKAGELRKQAETLADDEVAARDVLIGRFADQKRFEVYLAQRQLKEKAVARKREEKLLLEQIEQLRQAKARKELP